MSQTNKSIKLELLEKVKVEDYLIMSTRIQLSVRHFLWFAYTLPCFALFSCIGLSVLKDFEKSTRTHCNVYNFLPSISASIGDCEPQRYIWRLCFALDSVPRYIIGYLQTKRLLARPNVALPELYVLVQIFNAAVHFLELTCLLLLTYISSNEIKWIHECAFVGFMISSLVHMLCTVFVDYLWPRTSNRISEHEKNLRSKRLRWFSINILSFFISLYFYFRHNNQCEANIYSMYCLFEYFVVLTNIAYHAVVMEEWDSQGQIQIFY